MIMFWNQKKKINFFDYTMVCLKLSLFYFANVLCLYRLISNLLGAVISPIRGLPPLKLLLLFVSSSSFYIHFVLSSLKVFFANIPNITYNESVILLQRQIQSCKQHPWLHRWLPQLRHWPLIRNLTECLVHRNNLILHNMVICR